MASSNRVGEPVWIAPSAAARIGGETLPPLILNALGTRTAIDARLDGSIQDGSIESTTKGAPTLTLSVLDPDGEMLNSDLFARRIDLDMDNVPFRLVQVSRQEEDLLSLEFEHRLCSWLREHDTPRKASRGTKTRAEFAYSLVLEVKKEPIHFVSPDLDKRQPRAAEAVRPSTRKGRDGRKAPGFSDNATSLKIANAPATRSQLKNVDIALSVAASLKASPLATKAMVCAGIGESGFKVIANLQGSNYGGVFQGQFKGPNPGYPLWKIDDVEGMAQCFLKGGRGFQQGGAIALARRRPPLAAGAIAYMVEGDLSNFGGNVARATAFYQKWGTEAERLIDAWRGASSGGLSDAQKTGFAKFEFTRGAIHKGDAKEDSWMALQRLADEVRWRCFIDGRNVFYFVSDDQLMRSRPLYLVDRETQGVRSVTFDMEVGRRTVIYKGRRERKPSEATLRVRMGRWAAPPGSVIELADYGLADGRWLVDSMSRGIFDAEAEVHLRQPQRALPEPAPSRTSGDGGGSSGSGGSLGSDGDGSAAGTYVYPMGDIQIGGGIPMVSVRPVDMGVDYIGAGPVRTIGRCEITRVAKIGSPTGWPGPNGTSGAMIVYRLLDGSHKGKFVYLAENISPVGGLKPGDRLDAGKIYAQAHGFNPWLEIGWASNGAGQTLAVAKGHANVPRHSNTPEGKDFYRFLQYLKNRKSSGDRTDRSPTRANHGGSGRNIPVQS